MRHFHFFGGKTDLRGLCSVIGELVAVVVAHDHVHHSLHEGLKHVVVEALDWLDERLEGLTKTKSCKYLRLMFIMFPLCRCF